jgi:hypothetical protein
MAVEHALVALREHWDDVMARLGAANSEKLGALIENLGGADQTSVVTDIMDLLVETLPPEHPVRRALSEGYLFQPADLDLSVLALDLRTAADVRAKAIPPVVIAHSMGGLILIRVMERLLGAPALTEDEVRRRGADPADPGLIRLDRVDGGHQWPEFQFAPGGGPLPVVRAVNQLLDAAADPVGTADWWLSKNGWLDEEPCRLIGRVPDNLLLQAARAIRSEV